MCNPRQLSRGVLAGPRARLRLSAGPHEKRTAIGHGPGHLLLCAQEPYKLTSQLTSRPVHSRSPMSQDLTRILEGWEFLPDSQRNNVREIVGEDGRRKIQLRVKCGVIQWQAEGRPDGKRPEGFESMLELCEHLLADYEAANGTQDNFHLSDDVTRDVREEIMDYYHRRVMRFQLADYAGARADAEHNLELMGFIGRFVDDEEIVMSHEQYRPFVLMDMTRAAAMIHIEKGEPTEALTEVEAGMASIRGFYKEYSRGDLIDKSQELKVLQELRDRVREQFDLPFSPEEVAATLRQDLSEAVEDEDYERAARIKKQIERLSSPRESTP